MNINIIPFKTLLKKATLNHSIDNVQMIISSDSIKSKMISSSSDAIAILNVTNDIIPSVKKTDTLVFNFSEPNTTLVPFLNLIEEGQETQVKIAEEKITLTTERQKSNIFFCSPHVVSVFEGDSPREDIEYFKETSIDDDFISDFNKIKKIGAKFGKIYFGVSNNMLYIETCDKQNRFSNGLKIDICEVEYDDMSMCYDFKNVVNALSLIDSDDFIIKFAYVTEQELGMVALIKSDESEKYFLMSKTDN